MTFKDYLKILAHKDGSDIYLSAGAPPCGKFNSILRALQAEPITGEQIKEIACSVMNEDQRQEFEQKLEMNLAIEEPNIGRFRINIFRQSNEISMVVRNIKTEIPNMNDLGLPPVLSDVIMEKRGLVLFVGATGSGKSTSLATLIDHRNRNSSGHIITIEDPIEYVHKHKKSVINQREIGVDTLSYADALKNTLRQAPDVILIGEIRDRETMEHALKFAETGHLAISTLHANSANQALDRIINFFPESHRTQLLNDLSSNFKAIICQRLIPTLDGKRAAAIEVLRHSPMVAEMIKRNEIGNIKEIMEKSIEQGMKTMDGALIDLYKSGKISQEIAIQNADSANNVRLRINLSEQDVDKRGSGEEFSLQDIPKTEVEEDDEQPNDSQELVFGINAGAAPAPLPAPAPA